MGLIPKVDKPSPAFIHIDVDDLWAVAECYGYPVAEEWADFVSRDALPRFEKLFRDRNIKATFFIVGRDLERDSYRDLMQRLLRAGHRAANHSWSHNLGFRSLSRDAMHREVWDAHNQIMERLGTAPQGFRAPGYAASDQLTGLLDELGYKYDASLMPGPYGPVFRWMDRRLQRPGAPTGAEGKTQYPLVSDAFNSLYPAHARHKSLITLPSATSPLARLPFQAGVCMRLGYGYFRTCFEPFRWNRALPFVFLFHAADLADLSQVPYQIFQQSSFFNIPLERRLHLAGQFLDVIAAHRPIITTEEWLA